MKRRLGVILAASFVLAAPRAYAATITITPATTYQEQSTETNNLDAAGVCAELGIAPLSCTLTELYKQDVGAGSDGGSLASSYTTTFLELDGDSEPHGAEIVYNGGLFASCPECWLVVKDGNHDPAQYLFNLAMLNLDANPDFETVWNGTDTLKLTGFWPNGGAISHVSIFGGPSTTVPEPASLVMFASGLALLAQGLRKRKPAQIV